jgi:hypothetical protein
MINKYCAKLNLGFNIDFNIINILEKKIINKKEKQHFRIDDLIDINLLNFLKQFDLSIALGEVFFLPPGIGHSIHVDGPFMDNHCKINWVQGGGDSEMKWFKPFDKRAYQKLSTPIGTTYLKFDKKYCDEVYSCSIKSPSLVNTGQPHMVKNTSDSDRWALSYVLSPANIREKVQWIEAYKKLENFIEKD